MVVTNKNIFYLFSIVWHITINITILLEEFWKRRDDLKSWVRVEKFK